MSLDIERLESITQGDKTVERQLYKLFVETSDRCLAALENADDNVWEARTHELKGASHSIGAESLGDICHLSEGITDKDERRAVLEHIRAQAEEVKQWFENHLSKAA